MMQNKPLTTPFFGWTVATYSPAAGLVVESCLMTLEAAEAKLAAMSADDRLCSAVLPIAVECSNTQIFEWMTAALESRNGATHESTIEKIIGMIRESN